MEKQEEIKLKDNQKNLTYSIGKNENNFCVKVEKSIKINDDVNNLFEELKKYVDSVNNSNEFWPNSEIEYPDLMALWEITTILNNNKNRTDGALKYPDNWEEMLSKLKQQLLNIINENNHC